MTTAIHPKYFTGDWHLVRIRAHLDGLRVPAYPRSEDFQNAACALADVAGSGTWEEAAKTWHLEAIRFRLPGRSKSPPGPFPPSVLVQAAALMAQNSRKAR